MTISNALQSTARRQVAAHADNIENKGKTLALKYNINPCIISYERLSQARALKMRDGRDRWLGADCSFVLDNPALLPKGGSQNRHQLLSSRLALYFLADSGEAGPQQTSVFNALLSQIKLDAQLNSLTTAHQQSQLAQIALHGGDIVYPHGPVSDEPAEINRVMNAGLKVCQPIAQLLPFYAVFGNHEYAEGSVACDTQVLQNTLNNQVGMQAPGRYFTEIFEMPQSTVWVVAIDTSTLACDEEQQRWVQSQAQQFLKEKSQDKKQQLILAGHHPMLSYGEHGLESAYLQQLLYDVLEQTDLYLCGHEHDIQFLTFDQSDCANTAFLPSTLVCGTAAKQRDTSSGLRTTYASNAPGFSRITLSPRQLKVDIFELDAQLKAAKLQFSTDM